MAFPLQFAVPNKHAEIASGRAQSFVGRFGTMKLQVATDYVVPTYNPDGAGDYAYYGTRTPGRSVAVFDVGCQTGGTFEGEEARQNAHIFAYYVKIGLMPPELSLIAPYWSEARLLWGR